MKKLLILLLISNTIVAQINPTANLPWIKVQTARVATTNPSDLDDIAKGNTTIQYLDGSGRGLQTVNYKANPVQKDLIQGSNTLDPIGRPDKAYLPIASTAQNAQYQSAFASIAETFYNDIKPFSKVDIYDSSPLSSTLKTLGPGLAFQSSSTKGVSQDFQTAGTGIRKYTIVDATTINGSGTYQNGDLIKSISKDEDGNETIEYRGGKSGRLLQIHQKNRNSSEVLITAYVYDFMGRLRFIIPPKLYNTYSGTFFVSGSTFDGIYRYDYDNRSRLVESYKPGGGSIYSVYNALGQLVLSQNARQRESNLWEWVKYDAFGRKVLIGTVNTTASRSTLQGYFDSFTEEEQFEERATTSQLMGYTTRSFPSQITITESDVKAVYYYDNYLWVNNAALNFQEYKSPRWNNATGLGTGNKVKNLANNTWMTSVFYYDNKNRLIQGQTINRFGKVNQTDIVMNFAGEVLEERIIYRKLGQKDIIVSNHYTYDNAGRKTGAYQKVNGKVTPIAQYKHDEVGRLIQKNLMQVGVDSVTENSAQPNGDVDVANHYVLLQPGTISAQNGTYLAYVSPLALQQIDFSYNIRGQLRGINLDNSANISLTNGDIFGLKLDYFETGQTYNGKVNKQTWASRHAGITEARSFIYAYDGYDRINAAIYTGQGTENYSMPAVTYDANGNISTLQRNGLTGQNTWGQTDNLSYEYLNTTVGNKLNGIRDFSSSTVDFKDNGNASDYTYYNDGSLKSDANKGITNIVYNYLGLEERIEFGGNQRIENVYDAEGIKLSQKLVNNATSITTDYMGDLIYRNDTLVSIYHDEGRTTVRKDSSITNWSDTLGHSFSDTTRFLTLGYQFFISDHLGNTRAIIERINDSTALVQETHYGVWGDVLKGLGVVGDWKFLFQRKEYLDTFGYNNYDFHSRSYDPYSGRFNQLDGANQFSSGYTGMGNNPVSGVDPSGQWVHLAIGAAIGGATNLALNWKNINGNFWKGVGYFGVGAIAGALGAGIGAGTNVALAGGSFGAGFMGTATGVASTGIISGAATGASAGLANGFVSGTGNGLLGGNSFGNSLGSGLRSGSKQALFGGIFGGIGGGINAYSKGLNIWDGTVKLDLSSGVGAHGIIPDDPITGKYVGKFEGVDVYESSELGTGYGSGGITLPGRGITVGKGAFSKTLDMDLVGHEFGHTLQIKELGAYGFLKEVGLPSISSANRDGVSGWKHTEFWTEVWSNRLSHSYFKFNYNLGKYGSWDALRFPLQYKNMQDWFNVYHLLKH